MKKLMQTTVPIGEGIFYYAMFLIFFSLLLLVFTGCKVTEPAARNAFTKHPNWFADLVGVYYPPLTTYVKGDPILMPGDTVLIAGDSIPCPEKKEGATAPVKVKCPDSKFVHDTVFRIDTIQIENTAKIEAQAIELIAINRENERLNDNIDDMKRQRWYIFLFGMLSPIMVYGAFKLFKRIVL